MERNPSLQLRILRPAMRLARWYQGRLLKQGPSALQRFRKLSEQLANSIFRLPAGIRVEESQLEGLPGTWLLPDGAPENPVILFLHGGGNYFGWGSPHRRMVSQLAGYAGLAAFGLDFRLAPDFPYPSAHLESLRAYQALLKQGRKVLLVGESSGCLLALSVILHARQLGLSLPRLAAFISPLVDYLPLDHAGYDDPFVHPDFVNNLNQIYLAGSQPPDLDYRPLSADLRGFPPLYILVGEGEILRAQAEKLALKARQDGVDVALVPWPDVWHGWHILGPLLPEATQALQVFGLALQSAAR